MKRALLVALAEASVLLACANAPILSVAAPASPAPTPRLPPAWDPSALRFSLRAPVRMTYDAGSLGVVGQFVSIRIENTSAHPVSIARLHASFAATRESVAFPCNGHRDDVADSIEPSHLEPGESFTVERALDCTMPLPGRWDVRVSVYVQDRDIEHPAFVGSVETDVVAALGNAPRALPGHSGLYVLMAGASAAPPMPAEAWARGAYQVVVAMINGGDRPAAVGPAHVALRVFRKGSDFACAGREQTLDEPPFLSPGAVHLLRVPVTCAPSREGQYEIAGRLALHGEAETEIGRIGLLVTGNPDLLFTPERPAGGVAPWEGPPSR